MLLEIHEYQENVTPISVFSKVREKFGNPVALLESALTDSSNPFSIIAFNPLQEVITQKNSFEAIEKALKKTKKFPQNFHFAGGLIGYFNWEVFEEIESSKISPRPSLTRGEQDSELNQTPSNSPCLGGEIKNSPHALFYEFSRFFIFDHNEQKVFAIKTSFEDSENFHQENIEILSVGAIINRPSSEKIQEEKNIDFSIFKSENTQSEFEEKVAWAKEKILDGEIFQMIVSNGLSCDSGGKDGLDFYEALREIEPTTHLFFFDFGEHGQIAGASPEILGSKRGNKVLYSPIAGTRFRGKTKEKDDALLKEMQDDPKENAEHDMLVDLGRNDLGKICKTGSIKITKEKYARKFANLMHLVSDIEGEIEDSVTAIDFFKAIFPAGTLSGAPKIRAIDLINQIEKEQRGLYGGAVGYFSADGNMEFCIAIRSFQQKNGILKIRTGGGIVQDSVPADEWLESRNKAKSLCKVINYVLKR